MAVRTTHLALEVTCWLIGILFIATYFGALAYGEKARREAMADFENARMSVNSGAGAALDINDSNLRPLPIKHRPNQTRWLKSRVLAYEAARNESHESNTLPVALLRIDSVGLEVPVFADLNGHNLNRGAGLIAGSASPDSDGNVAIAAHRDGFFRALKDIVIGDIIEIKSLSRRRLYRVTGLSIVKPTDIRPLQNTGVPVVTLVTCYPFYFAGPAPQRYVVRATAAE